MTFFQAIILGIVQGITEFLPISSSGHLVLIPHLFNWSIPDDQLFPFDVLVQIGTLVAIIIYYREDIVIILKAMLKSIKTRNLLGEVESRIGWLSLLATIPAGAIGILIKPVIQSSFTNPAVPSIFLLLTAGLLIVGELIDKKNREIDDITWKDALWIGAFQVLSVFPGVSRSGSTIAGGMIRNLKRRTAGQFAFLMAIPIMAAAGLIGLIELQNVQDLKNFLPILVTGFIVSSVVGYLAISWLLKYINNHSLLTFAGYCIFLGAGSLALLLFNPQASANNVPASTSQTAGQHGQTYQIGINPELEWLIPAMNSCQQEISETTFLYQQYANSEDALDLFNAYFTYGQPAANANEIYQIGENQLVLVANPGQSLEKATIALVNSIFAGRATTWQAASDVCTDCFSTIMSPSSEEITIWALPEDSYLWKEFKNRYLTNPLSSFAMIAPDASTLRQQVSADSNAIGVLPSGWVDSSVKTIAIQEEPDTNKPIPITVSTQTEPDNPLSSWITCIQSALNE